MNKEDFCGKYQLTEKQFFGEEWIKHGLTIYEDELPEGFNPKVNGGLRLPNLKIIPPWFNPVVRWELRLPSVTSFDKSFDPVVGTCLYLNSLSEIPFMWKPTISGSLVLVSITTLPEWFEPTALRVRFNHDEDYTDKFRPANEFYSWMDGKYIEVDGIRTEVIKQRGKVYHVKEFGKDEIFYLITDGNGVFAHGKTLSEAKADLKFKLAEREERERYKSLTLESVLTFGELIVMYRLITGACQFGVNEFIKDNKVENKSYSIAEVIALTDGDYGNETFKKFFNYD